MLSGFAPGSLADGQWAQAIQRNSRIAARAFAVLFATAMITQSVLLHTMADRRPGGYLLYSLPLLLGLMAGFEWWESRQVRAGVSPRVGADAGMTVWIAAAIEALAPISAIALLAAVFGWPVALGSPPLVAASLIPMVSILRLDFRVCVLQGAVAAAGFGALVLISRNMEEVASGGLRDPVNLEFGKAMLLFAGGGLAGFVAYQGRKRLIEVIRADTERETARKSLQARTADYQRAEVTIEEKDALISILSHDLRAPLDGVAGLAELMARTPGAFSADEISRYAGEIRRTAQELRELLDNLVVWAELRAGDRARVEEPLSLTQTVAAVARLFESAITARDIDFKAEVSPAIFVEADEVGLATVVRNVLSNAVKFTARGGRIELWVEEVEGRSGVVLAVSDTGRGGTAVGERQADAVGESGAAREPVKGRRGLGLALCRQLLEQMGGAIELRSRAKGGTEVRVSLRRSEAGARGADKR